MRDDENAARNSSTASESNLCPHCGQNIRGRGELAEFLSRLGISEEMLDNLKGQFVNVDIDEYLNTARDYLDGSRSSAHRLSSPRRIVLFPTDEGTVDRRTLEDAIDHAVVNR